MRISDWSSDVCSSDLVDEFSSFARMPAPVMRREDIGRLVEQAVFLQRTAQPQVQFGYTPPPQPLVVPCDGRQVSQALTNLIKNARSEEHTSELQSLMRTSYDVFCLKKKTHTNLDPSRTTTTRGTATTAVYHRHNNTETNS